MNSEDSQTPELRERFHVGMRTFKTALSVMLVIMLYDGWIGRSAAIPALTAVIAQKTSFSETHRFAWLRVFGTGMGALVSFLIIFLDDELHLSRSLFVHALLIGIGVVIVIVSCNVIDQPAMTVGALAVFMVVICSIPDENKYLYVIYRLIDTLVGGSIAVAVEALLPRKHIDRLERKWLAFKMKWQRRLRP